ncbi:MAG: site-specific DNA-methyltransferase [Bacteroidota bacterium]
MLPTLHYPDKWTEEQLHSYQTRQQLSLIKGAAEARGQFYFGDNLPILALLREQVAGKVDLIYIDPPFGTGQSFANLEQEVAYEDPKPDHHFLEFLRRRLWMMHQLLSERGSLYLHIDKKLGHYVKLIADEVFGSENFINDLTRIKCNPKNFARKAYGNYSDMILFYAKNRDQQIWQDFREPLTESDISTLFPKQDQDLGPYTTHPLHAPGETTNGDTGKSWKGLNPPQGRHWRYTRKVLDQLDEQGLIEWSSTGNPRKKYFAKDHPGKKVQDVWEFKDKGLSYVNYPTEKNHDLLRRIILHSSEPDSLVLDAFAGSGGTLLVAEELGRRWIGIDASPQSLSVIESLLQQHNIAFNRFDLI